MSIIDTVIMLSQVVAIGWVVFSFWASIDCWLRVREISSIVQAIEEKLDELSGPEDAA